VYFDPHLNIEIIGVPLERIKKHYKPEERVIEILEMPRDSFEVMVAEMIQEISSTSRISTNHFGVTGSILVKIHNPSFSDIDLTVYGYENALKAKHALIELLKSSKNFRRLNKDEIEKYAKEISRIHALNFTEASMLFKERWYAGILKTSSSHFIQLKLKAKYMKNTNQESTSLRG